MKYIYNTLKNNEKYNFTKRKRKNTVKHEQNKKNRSETYKGELKMLHTEESNNNFRHNAFNCFLP